MKIGLVYPQTEYGNDPGAIRDYAQAAEGLGYSHIVAYDHVLGANPNRPGGWQGVYTHQSAFQEPFVLFGFMAGITRRIGFAPGVIILPQRQTVLVAKQAATLDVLSGGRLRLGVGLGWNTVEYAALNENFHNRGRRIEEQVALLRQLWRAPLVQFEGRWHRVPDAGLNPLPLQQPIPLWFGGREPRALQRAARLGDGWFSNNRNAAEAQPSLDLLRQTLAEVGRQAHEFGIEARLPFGAGNPAEWESLLQGWQAAGATHLSLNTMGAGLSSPDAHLRAISTFAGAVGLQPPTP
jgi:probable F420-dependent oxidoreductase